MLTEHLLLLASDVDDESPQVLAVVQRRALEAGALDCVLIPTLMKKGRQGTRIEVLCREDARELLVGLLLTESSTLGVRVSEVERHSLEREMRRVSVQGANIAVKVALVDGAVLRATPEFNDCVAVAEGMDIPVRQILDEARAAALEAFPPGQPLPPSRD